MNNFRKILCVVLAFAMLMSGIVFVVGADDSAAAAAEPTVTTVLHSKDADTLSATKWADDSNQLTGFGYAASGTYQNNPSKVVDAHIVTEAGNSDSYVALVAKEDHKGTHVQFILTSSSMPIMANQHYYVIELDVATQSVLHTALQISPMHRKSDGSDTSLFGAGVVLSKYLGDPDADWVHVSIVGHLDVALTDDGNVDAAKTVNKQYVYVNGVQVGEQVGAINDSNLKAGNTPENFNDGNGLYAQGIRIELPAAQNIYVGQSIMLDNISRRDFTLEAATANGLADIVAQGKSGSLSEWSGYPASTRANTSLANVVSVDGVKYNNVADVNSILSGNVAHEVTVLGNNAVPIHVGCDATIKTNGFSPVFTYASDAEVEEVDGVISVDVPYVSPITHTAISAAGDSIAAIKYPAEDNLFYKVITQHLDALTASAPNAKAHMQQYISSVIGSSNTYATYMVTRDITLPNEEGVDFHTHTNYDMSQPDGTGTYATVQAGSVAADGTDTRQYVVFEWDMYTESSMPYAMYIGITTRDGSGNNKGGAAFHLDNYQTDNHIQPLLPIGEWYHMTLVGDVQTNTLYVYINNALVTTRTGGLTNTASILSDGSARLYGPRINVYASKDPNIWNRSGEYKQVAGASFSMDNYYARLMTGDAAGNLASLIGSNDISTWTKNVYDEDYKENTLPKSTAAISIDGAGYNNVATASAALFGNMDKSVQILRPVRGLAIGCNAVIETNGFDFVEGTHYTVPEGAEQSWNGTVLTVKVPYQPNATYTELTGAAGSLSGIVDTTVTGNILAGAAGSVFIPNNGDNSVLVADDEKQRLIPYLVNTADGDSYYMLIPDESTYGGNYAENPYVYIENYGIEDNSNKLSANGYYVIDLDLYTESDFITNISIAPTNRNAPKGGGYPFGDSFRISNYVPNNAGWVHVTYVADVAANESYVYVDGVYAGKAGVAYKQGSDSNTIEQGIYAVGFRIDLGAKMNVLPGQMLAFRGVSERVYASDDAAGGIAAAIEAGSLAGWSGNIAGYQGKAPAIATIDGVEYDNVTSASKALSGTDVNELVFTRDFQGTVSIDTQVSVITHGFGSYEAVQSTTSYGEGEEKITIVGKYIVSDLGDGNYDVIEVNPDNVDANATQVWWIIDEENGIFEITYYVYGQEISYVGNNAIITNGNYIANGNLTTFNSWIYLDEEGNPIVDENDEPVASLGVASAEYAGIVIAYADFTVTEGTDITIGNLLYNLTLYTDFRVNIYVPVSATDDILSSLIVKIDGVDHYVLTESVSATEVADDITYVVTFTKDGVKYAEEVVVSVVDYAIAVLEGDYSKMLKKTVMSALAYAAEACNALTEPNAEIGAVLTNPAYAEFVVAGEDEYVANDMSALHGIIDSVQLSLDAAPTYVINVSKDYAGVIVITYTGIDGEKTLTYEVEGGEQIYVEGLKAYDMILDYTITAGDASAVYNLATYIKGLEEAEIDADFAKALYTYASIASDYKAASNRVVGA